MNAEEISIRIGYDDDGNIHWADMPEEKEALIKKALAFRRNESQQAMEETIEKMCNEQHDCRWLDTADFEKYLRKIASEQKNIDIDKACEWFANYLFEIGYPDDWVRDNGTWINGAARFRKAMED